MKTTRGPYKSRRSRRIGRCDQGLAAVEFALIAPILLMLVFGIIIYSLYFCAYMGVRVAASEGARAAVMGLSGAERTTLATARVTQVLEAYRPLIGTSAAPTIEAVSAGTGLFRVRVSYDITGSPIMKFANLLPMPTAILQSEITVSNGSY
ncbi:MAG: TadE-like protein [Sphingomonadales bacterium]|nr:TadE-like protein [Sphingomonadales bacterium]